MAYIIPIEQPLSETQAKLIAQIGSMKNLTDLPFFKKFKLNKNDEISLYDYLIKVLRAMGIDPQILIVAFLNEFFRTEKLVDFFLITLSKLSASAYKKLDANFQLSFALEEGVAMTDKQKSELIQSNYNWLKTQSILNSALTTGVNFLKTRIIQELMIIIFGKPKKNEAAFGENGLTYSEDRLNELIEESICGGDSIFSVSIPASSNSGDLTYNRLQKIEQAKNGNLSFQITCESVQISLPDDPTYLFTDVPPGFQGGQILSPQDAITNVFNFVGNKVQKNSFGVSSQSNATTAEKNFAQKFLETLISSITCLISPFFVGFVNLPPEVANTSLEVQQLLTNGLLNFIFPNSIITNPDTGKREGDFAPATSCEINSLIKNQLTDSHKKKIALMTILCNLLLNLAISFILSYVLEKVKDMIKKFIAKRAQAKIERKTEKIKKKYETSIVGRTTKKIERSQRQLKLLQSITKLLQPIKNSSLPNI